MADKKYITTIQSSPWDSFNRDDNIVTAYACTDGALSAAKCDISDASVLSGCTYTDSGISASLGKGTVSLNEMATKDEMDDKFQQIKNTCVDGKTLTTGLNQLQAQINELRAQIEKPVETLGTLRRALKTLKYEREVV
jgi:hypothetical protein